MPRKGPARSGRSTSTRSTVAAGLQLVSKVLLDGKKQVAQRIVYTAPRGCREKTGTDPVVTPQACARQRSPAIEVKSRRVGGATYQVPVEVGHARHHAGAALAGRLRRRPSREDDASSAS